ncbi:hypothetical protein Tco_1003860 [Tanacetum coccineum]|uniref:UBN2 domain-containing protein n=1 Tax=Tanacetum coccineum TaxID=301880 RepID=A0ABQ5FC50_9ASTR
MIIYDVLPKKEYERIFMLKTAKEISQSLLITHQGNKQVKDNNIDLLFQQYEQFSIFEDESMDSGFAKFSTIVMSLKALDENFSSKNFVRRFLRALHPKWRAKVTTIEESKDLSSLSLDELIAERKNGTLIEAARTMLNGSVLSKYPPDEYLHEDDPSRQYQSNSNISYYVISHGRSLIELTLSQQVPEVIAQNEPASPHTKVVEGPPDLVNIKGTNEQNIQDEQIITQPSDSTSWNNTEVLVPTIEPSVSEIHQY